MKKLLSLLALFAVTISFGQAIETFSYTGTLNSNGWSTHSGTAGQLSTLTTAASSGNSLNFTGLATPAGNRAVISNSGSEDVNFALTNITGDVGYYSFIFNVKNTTGLSTSGNYFFGFGATSGATVTNLHARLHIKAGVTPNTFQIGMANSGTSETYDPTEYAVNTDHFIVVRYDKSATQPVAEIYMNPTPGGTMPASPSVSDASSTSVLGTFASLYIRQSTGTGNTEIDEIRADSTWAAVTPAGVASCNIASTGLASLTCNDAGTGSDPVDDYLTFDLNPTGTLLGTTYTVSVSSGTITPTTGTYGAATSFQLQGGSAGAGNVVVTISDDGTSGCSTTENITDPGACSSATPVITLAPSALTGFDFIAGTPSPEQTFTASGLGLTGDITLTAPADYAISLTAGSGFNPTLVLPQTAGVVTATTIYVIGTSPVMGTFSGDIVGTSAGAVNDSVHVSGTVDGYVYSTIDLVTTTDPNGIANSLGNLVELTGVLHCIDFDGNSGYSLTLIDGSNEGINFFGFNDVSGYTSPLEGDSVRVFGAIGQFNGLLQVEVDSVELLSQGAALVTPTVVTMLDETTESQVITLENLTFVTPIATFPTGSNNIDVTDGVNTFAIRIDSDTDIPGAAAPQGTFHVTGVGGQFDNSSPYTDGYQLFPCSLASFEDACTTPSNVVTLTDATTAMAAATGTGITYQWIDCSDNSPVTGATSQSYTATVAGNYAVIVMDATCSDTSNCLPLTPSTQGLGENALANAISVYPNPSATGVFTFNNTSSETMNVTITDVAGRIINTFTSEMNEGTIDLSIEAKGTYYVQFATDSAAYTARIIKQ